MRRIHYDSAQGSEESLRDNSLKARWHRFWNSYLQVQPQEGSSNAINSGDQSPSYGSMSTSPALGSSHPISKRPG